MIVAADSPHPADTGWQRRDFLAGLALLGLAVGPAAAAVAASAPQDANIVRYQGLMRDVAQIVIPRTDTAGAGDVGAGAFVLLGLAHGLGGAHQPVTTSGLEGFSSADGRFDHARWLALELDRRAGGDFAHAGLPARQAAVAGLDRDAFADAPMAQPWRTIKNLVLTGYYTSEIGGSKELNYELVPGRWDPDVPVTPTTRAYSSDWTAIDFG
ncbi:gluconate 2-dehydrogenase subunit 3 family protein [Novosphingobium capsulatum]|uniref:gluconate 2-dehydrogenase subunit 3 family protein n=1 Tax=Novosphingobium capsulatum TaxID=13688 RepID=UPI0007896B71|nr:gluconate 2-dehydrogenase subunit 3 family protein [Novosphingobium capsulatum]WQD95046.1 gluconate 2-dehydrogenase subunit 3 family protein [Novosphingobium capsulatum]